jgi:hypothetical protein
MKLTQFDCEKIIKANTGSTSLPRYHLWVRREAWPSLDWFALFQGALLTLSDVLEGQGKPKDSAF